jgi:hypothetical protein
MIRSAPLAGRAVHRRMFTATAMGFFEKELLGRSSSRLRTAHHQQRRQLRFAGGDPGDRAMALSEVRLRDWWRRPSQ